jgi:hypothetical protein
MEKTNQGKREDIRHLSSGEISILIVDALVDANIIKEKDFEKAVEISKLEIDVRKHAENYK